MQEELLEIVDISRVEELLKSLCDVTGIPLAILDKDLKVLRTIGRQDICPTLHRIQLEIVEKCKANDNDSENNIQGNSSNPHRFKNGMLDFVYPITIGGIQEAALVIGPFFTKVPQEDFLQKQAQEDGFDEKEYIVALKKLPIIAEDSLESIKIFFTILANFIGDMGQGNLNQLKKVSFLQNIINAIPSPMFYKDVRGIYQGCNNAFAEFMGMPREKIIGSSVYDLSPPELANKYKEMDEQLFDNKEIQSYEHQAVNGQGELREFIFNKAPYFGLNEQVAGLVGVMTDITRKKELEIALKNSETKYRDLLNNLCDGFAYFQSITDEVGNITDYHILEVNKACEKLLGLTRNQLVGKTINETIFRVDNVEINWIQTFQELSDNQNANTLEFYSKLLSKWLLIAAYSSEPGYCAIVLSDITEQKRSIERAEHYAYHDPLTGLPNRRLFDDRLALAIAQGKRENKTIGIAFLDLDKFKEVNDTLGHEPGDILLQEVACRLTSCIREGDTASRIGGDEFVLILPDLEGDDIEIIINRILEKCRQPFKIKQYDVTITVSIGVSFFPRDGQDVTSLVRNADIAMYLCKEQGRDGACYATKEVTLHPK